MEDLYKTVRGCCFHFICILGMGRSILPGQPGSSGTPVQHLERGSTKCHSLLCCEVQLRFAAFENTSCPWGWFWLCYKGKYICYAVYNYVSIQSIHTMDDNTLYSPSPCHTMDDNTLCSVPCHCMPTLQMLVPACRGVTYNAVLLFILTFCAEWNWTYTEYWCTSWENHLCQSLQVLFLYEICSRSWCGCS